MTSSRRRIVQIITALAINSYIPGFMEGSLYRGSLKNLCVPGLNCSSCPGAWGTCPVGMLQAGFAGLLSLPQTVAAVAVIFILGIAGGRWVCGWICPFGLLQELIYKLPLPKSDWQEKLKHLEYLPYAVLTVSVVIVPLLGIYGLSSSAFCRYLCPVEVAEANLPIIMARPAVMYAVSFGLAAKTIFLIILVVLALFIFKPFCRYICPLGAIYAVFNPVSLYRLEVDRFKCTACGSCQTRCPAGIAVYEEPNHRQCLRCNECRPCPAGALDRRRYNRPGHRKRKCCRNLRMYWELIKG